MKHSEYLVRNWNVTYYRFYIIHEIFCVFSQKLEYYLLKVIKLIRYFDS